MADDIGDEFTGAGLGDARLNRRLAVVARALASVPSSSISAASGGWAETVAAYRLLNHPDVTPEALLAPHHEAVVRRCAEHSCVVVAQDTTELDFSHMRAMKGTGPLNSEERRGFFMHSLQAISGNGLPLGVLGARFLVRDDASFRGTGTRKRKPVEEKESLRWLDGYRRTCELAARLPDREIWSVSDREGDLFEVFEAWQEAAEGPRAEWIIRANHDRALPDSEPARLFAALAAAPLLGTSAFEITARQGTRKVKGSTVAASRTARTVHLEIRAMRVTPRPPHRPGRKLPRISFHAVLAVETNPPEGEIAISWLLLTSRPVATLEEALRILDLYRRRWDIEVFHRVLKTGCRVESVQLKDTAAAIKALAIYTVIAWRILYLTRLGRECPDLPCGCVFEEAEWKAACAVVKRPAEAGEPTLAEFTRILGKLGGHLGRKGDGPPGPRSIWQGLSRARDFALAWQAFHGMES